MFATNLLTSPKTKKLMCITNLLSPITVIYTIYISIMILEMCVTNLLVSFTSVKREYHLIASIQLSGRVVIYFSFTVSGTEMTMIKKQGYNLTTKMLIDKRQNTNWTCRKNNHFFKFKQCNIVKNEHLYFTYKYKKKNLSW